MGLDNGINIYIKNDKKYQQLKNLYNLNSYSYLIDKNGFEVLYWRKCWNVRNLVGEILAERSDTTYAGDPSMLDAELSLDCFEAILNRLREELYSVEGWREYNNSIWDWVDIDEDGESHGVADNYWYHLTKAYQVLEFLRFNCTPDEYVIEFYDSY